MVKEKVGQIGGDMVDLIVRKFVGGNVKVILEDMVHQLVTLWL